MTYTLVTNRHRQEWTFEHSTLEEAVQNALDTLESDEAWPVRILEDATVIWEESGPLLTRVSLEELKERIAGKSPLTRSDLAHFGDE